LCRLQVLQCSPAKTRKVSATPTSKELSSEPLTKRATDATGKTLPSVSACAAAKLALVGAVAERHSGGATAAHLVNMVPLSVWLSLIASHL
jgi:hypothetical protein